MATYDGNRGPHEPSPLFPGHAKVRILESPPLPGRRAWSHRPRPVREPNSTESPKALSASHEPVTAYEVITGYNNYYEFGTGKGDPAKNAQKFVTSPWTLTIEGAVAKPKTLDLDGIMKIAPLEERIYRHRCVERWSIVVPWIGFSLSTLLKQVEPTVKAKYVAFQSYYDPKQMPRGQVCGHQVALRRRLAHRRSHASAGDAGRRPLWRGAAEPERRSATPRRAVEVRLQEHQVDRQNQAGRERASHDLEPRQRSRIRLLLQRESRSRPSSLEPGEGAPVAGNRACDPRSNSTATTIRSRAFTRAWILASTTSRRHE